MLTFLFKLPSISRKHEGGRIDAIRSRGAVLVVSLIFLLLLTMLALASSRTSLLQEKMVGATRNAQLATFGAESALREAEARLWSARLTGSTAFLDCGRSGSSCYDFDPENPVANVQAFRTQPGWLVAGAQSYRINLTDSTDTRVGNAALAQNPVYIIEDLGLVRPPGTNKSKESGGPNKGGGNTGFESHIYRVTARSTGGNAKVVRVLQSTFSGKSD